MSVVVLGVVAVVLGSHVPRVIAAVIMVVLLWAMVGQLGDGPRWRK
jgi:hypothetical protein